VIAILLAMMLASQDAAVGKAITGPSVACGAAFLIDLKSGERLSWTDNGMDFIVYTFVRPDGSTVIYEGNFPQSGGIERTTGRQWPAIVSVHGTADVAARVLTDAASLRRCPSATGK